MRLAELTYQSTIKSSNMISEPDGAVTIFKPNELTADSK